MKSKSTCSSQCQCFQVMSIIMFTNRFNHVSINETKVQVFKSMSMLSSQCYVMRNSNRICDFQWWMILFQWANLMSCVVNFQWWFVLPIQSRHSWVHITYWAKLWERPRGFMAVHFLWDSCFSGFHSSLVRLDHSFHFPHAIFPRSCAQALRKGLGTLSACGTQ